MRPGLAVVMVAGPVAVARGRRTAAIDPTSRIGDWRREWQRLLGSRPRATEPSPGSTARPLVAYDVVPSTTFLDEDRLPGLRAALRGRPGGPLRQTL